MGENEFQPLVLYTFYYITLYFLLLDKNFKMYQFNHISFNGNVLVLLKSSHNNTTQFRVVLVYILKVIHLQTYKIKT